MVAFDLRCDSELAGEGIEMQRQKYSGEERDRGKDPQRIADIVSALMARRGYARLQSSQLLGEVWQQVAGKLANHTRPGNCQRGLWEIHVDNSAVLQELNFNKATLISDINRLAPDQQIKDLKFRLGQIRD